MTRPTPETLATRLQQAAGQVPPGARYVHYKDPTRQYEVVGFGILEADDSVAVLYKALYDDGFTFIRSLTSFLDTVTHDGETLARFTKVS